MQWVNLEFAAFNRSVIFVERFLGWTVPHRTIGVKDTAVTWAGESVGSIPLNSAAQVGTDVAQNCKIFRFGRALFERVNNDGGGTTDLLKFVGVCVIIAYGFRGGGIGKISYVADFSLNFGRVTGSRGNKIANGRDGQTQP